MMSSSTLTAIQQQAMSSSLIEFTKLMYPGYRPAAFHLRIAEELEAVARGETRYLVIMLPPRHGKSLLASQHFPSWYLGQFPDRRIIACSYGDDLAHTFSRHARNMLRDERWPFPEVQAAADARAVRAWDIAGHRGGYRAAGVGAGITGHGANCLAGDTQVVTPRGLCEIRLLHRNGYRGPVLAFEHRLEMAVWRNVIASREVFASELVELSSDAGRSIRCTADHLVFVPGLGYREAGRLQVGDGVVAMNRTVNTVGPGDTACRSDACKCIAHRRPAVRMAWKRRVLTRNAAAENPSVALRATGRCLHRPYRRRAVPLASSGGLRLVRPIASDSVAAVGRVRSAEPVYDLQVAGTSNFFANGMLVHNCLLIDDAVKDKEQADSEVMREKTWDWYQSTSFTRLDPSGGAVVLIGTRWNADDLIGRALQDGDYWRVLRLPAEAEEDDPLGRKPGEWLWPEQFSAERYQEIRARIGPRNWNALYQQRPTSEEGAMFPRSAWRSYRPGAEPAMREIVISVDGAFKQGVGSDYTVFAVWGSDGLGSYYVLDRLKERLEFPELIAAGHRLYAQWRYRCRKVALLVEDRASGQSAIQVWSRVSYGPSGTLPALPVLRWNVPSGRSKESRADEVTHLVLAGHVYLPDNTPWVADFVQEHVEFPHGAHDDQVDTTSQALGWFLNQPRRGVMTF